MLVVLAGHAGSAPSSVGISAVLPRFDSITWICHASRLPKTDAHRVTVNTDHQDCLATRLDDENMPERLKKFRVENQLQLPRFVQTLLETARAPPKAGDPDRDPAEPRELQLVLDPEYL